MKPPHPLGWLTSRTCQNAEPCSPFFYFCQPHICPRAQPDQGWHACQLQLGHILRLMLPIVTLGFRSWTYSRSARAARRTSYGLNSSLRADNCRIPGSRGWMYSLSRVRSYLLCGVCVLGKVHAGTHIRQAAQHKSSQRLHACALPSATAFATSRVPYMSAV